MDSCQPPARLQGIFQGIPGQFTRLWANFPSLNVRRRLCIGSRTGFRVDRIPALRSHSVKPKVVITNALQDSRASIDLTRLLRIGGHAMYFVVAGEANGHLAQTGQGCIAGHDLRKLNTTGEGTDSQSSEVLGNEFEGLCQNGWRKLLEKEFPIDHGHFLTAHPPDGSNVLMNHIPMHRLLNGCRVSRQKVIQHLQSLGIDPASGAGAHQKGFSDDHRSSVSRLVRRRVHPQKLASVGASG